MKKMWGFSKQGGPEDPKVYSFIYIWGEYGSPIRDFMGTSLRMHMSSILVCERLELANAACAPSC